MDGLLGARLGAGIDGDAHLPTRFLESFRRNEAKSVATTARSNLVIKSPLKMKSSDYIAEALKQQLRAQDKWGDLNNLNSRLSNDLREIVADTNPFALGANSPQLKGQLPVALPRLLDILNPKSLNPASLNQEMIMGTALSSQHGLQQPPAKRYKKSKQRKPLSDPLSMQRRKTRHAFTERDRTRKLASRIVEMGNILTAAGRYCKQEKLPILSAAVKYVYELQDRFRASAAKKARLLPRLKQLKEEIAKCKDEPMEHDCQSDIIFQEVLDMEPCGGKCASIDYVSSFKSKSFPVVMVSSRDFTVMANNKLFRKMMEKKEDDPIIGTFLPQLMHTKCEHVEAFLKRCVELLQNPSIIEKAAARIDSRSNEPTLQAFGSLNTNRLVFDTNTLSNNETTPIADDDFAPHKVSPELPPRPAPRFSPLHGKELPAPLNYMSLPPKSKQKAHDAHVDPTGSNLTKYRKVDGPVSPLSQEDILLANATGTRLPDFIAANIMNDDLDDVAPRRVAARHIAPRHVAPRHVAPRHVAPRPRAAAPSRTAVTEPQSNQFPTQPAAANTPACMRDFNNGTPGTLPVSSDALYRLPALSSIGQAGPSHELRRIGQSETESGEMGALLQIPELPVPLQIPNLKTTGDQNRGAGDVRVAHAADLSSSSSRPGPATERVSTNSSVKNPKTFGSTCMPCPHAFDVPPVASGKCTGVASQNQKDAALSSRREMRIDRPVATARIVSAPTRVQPWEGSSREAFDRTQCGKDTRPKPNLGRCPVAHLAQKGRCPVAHLAQKGRCPVAHLAQKHVTQTSVPMLNETYLFSPPTSSKTAAMQHADKIPPTKSCFTAFLQFEGYIAAANLLDQSKIQVSFLPTCCMRVSSILPQPSYIKL